MALFKDILPWIVVLLVLVVLGGTVIAFTRRAVRRESSSVGGFTLHDLRQLHAAGELSDEEFQRAKDSLIGRYAGAPATADAVGDGSGGDADSDAESDGESDGESDEKLPGNAGDPQV